MLGASSLATFDLAAPSKSSSPPPLINLPTGVVITGTTTRMVITATTTAIVVTPTITRIVIETTNLEG